MPDHLGRLLLVTLEAARVSADLPVLGALRSWLDSWSGIGRIAVGMARQGFDLQLTRYDERAGARRSTRPGWSTCRRARPAPDGSARRGKRRSGRRGRR
jgi:hypothetical protein